LLGQIDLGPWMDKSSRYGGIDWVIAGGESGHHARPTNPEWFRSIRDQCERHNVAFHFKQWGNWCPVSPNAVNGYRRRNMQGAGGQEIVLINVGKKTAGRQLDGTEWDGLPGAS